MSASPANINDGSTKPPRLVVYALAVAGVVAATVACSVLSHDEPARAGAAGVGLGVAAGSVALLGGAKVLASWGFGLAAGSGGFLVIALIFGRRLLAGVSLTLSIGAIGSLLAVAVTLQRGLPWYHAALFAAIPLAVRLPMPQRSSFGQVAMALVYALAAAAVTGLVI